MAKSINAMRYLECSAKHKRGVKECFQETAKVALSGTRNNTKKKLIASSHCNFFKVKLKKAHGAKKTCILL